MTKRTWWERLNEALAEGNMSPADLGRAVIANYDADKHYSRFKKWTEGKREGPPTGELLEKVAIALDVNENWLTAEVQPKKRGHSPLKRIPKIHLSDLATLRSKADLPKLLRGREDVQLPAQAGPRAMVVELPDDSMAEKFMKGALVVCDPDQPVIPGRYVVAVVRRQRGPEAVFRRFQEVAPDQGVGVLHAENENFAPIPIKSDKDGFILGRAIGLYTDI